MSSNHEEELLKLITNSIEGTFDGLQWSVSEVSHKELVAKWMASKHEDAHLELNNCTIYGNIMGCYANLNALAGPGPNMYLSILKLMVKKSLNAHETFATWMSMISFMNGDSEAEAVTLLKGKANYFNYYEKALQLVSGMPKRIHQIMILNGIISWCFQSHMIANVVLNKMDHFWLPEIDELEFPDARLKYVCDSFSGEDIALFFNQFLTTTIDDPYHILFKDQLDTDEFDKHDEREVDHLVSGLKTALFALLSSKYPYQTRTTLPLEQNRPILYRLFEIMGQLYPRDRYKHPLSGIAPDPCDYSRNVSFLHEQGSVNFFMAPLHAIIISPRRLSKVERLSLLEDCISDQQVVFMNRIAATLAAQYQFVHQEATDWIAKQETISFIRFKKTNTNGVETVTLVVFTSERQLKKFLKPLPDHIKIIGCTAMNSFLTPNYHKSLPNIFAATCDKIYVLNDQSFVYAVEKYFPSKSHVERTRLLYLHNDRAVHCHVFRYQEKSRTVLMLFPCWETMDAFYQDYLPERFPQYNHIFELTDVEKREIKAILNNIYQQEYFWRYWPGAIINELLSN